MFQIFEGAQGMIESPLAYALLYTRVVIQNRERALQSLNALINMFHS